MMASVGDGTELYAAYIELADRIAPDLSAGRLDIALEHFMPALAPGRLLAIIKAELAALIERAPGLTKNAPAAQLRFVDGPDAEMRVRIVHLADPPCTHLKTLTRNMVIGNAGGTPLTVRLWCQPTPHPNDVFDAQKTIEWSGDRVLGPGEALALRAGYDAYELEAEARAAVALTLGGAHILPLTWLYRRDTRRARSVEPVRREWLRLQEVLAFATLLGDPELAPAVAALERHPSHFIRWAAAKTTLRLAPALGHATIEALAGDSHPQVRAAARHLLLQRTPA